MVIWGGKENGINLHVGCGTVYLKGWLNVDYNGLSSKTNKKSLSANKTDIQHYYKYTFNTVAFNEIKKRDIVLDLKADATHLPIASNSINRILTVNFINHVRFQDFIPMMKDWQRILKPDGELIIDVDDVVGMSQNVVNSRSIPELEKALRYLHCHSKTQFDSHLWGYTAEYLKYLLEPLGFNYAWRNDEFIHHDADYPRFLVAFKKLE